MKQVLKWDPQNSDALISFAFAYADHAKVEVARRLLKIVERNDPLLPRLPIWKGYMHWIDGRFDLAIETLQRSQDGQIPDIPSRMLYAMMFIYSHRPEDAARQVEALEKEVPGSYFARSMRFFLDAYRGNKAGVERIITPDFIQATKQDYQYSVVAAGAYAVLGEKEEALDWLENAVDLGFSNYIYMSQHDPLLKNLREEERFKEIVSRAKARCDRFEGLE